MVFLIQVCDLSGHNKKLLREYNEQKKEEKEYNCKKGAICPVGGKRLNDNIIYQAIVTEKISKKVETYIGLASTSFKARLANHKASMKNRNLEKNCKLAQHI